MRRRSGEYRCPRTRLLRHGGFYHAVTRYGQDLWTPFTYAGIHATERVLRRKEQHRFWGVDCYCHEEDRYLRIGNRTFYEDPDQEVEPSAQDVVAVDAWARELARSTLSNSTPIIFCTPDGQCTPAVELRPSREASGDLPHLALDRMRMSQALGNVIGNALNCTGAGGNVQLKAGLADDRTVPISVTDNGMGIDAADLPHVFDRFYRTDQSRSLGIGGTGLGLAITRAIVEAHGGNISIASEGPGQGVTVTVRLLLNG